MLILPSKITIYDMDCGVLVHSSVYFCTLYCRRYSYTYYYNKSEIPIKRYSTVKIDAF